jgi:hypothetical protein
LTEDMQIVTSESPEAPRTQLEQHTDFVQRTLFSIYLKSSCRDLIPVIQAFQAMHTGAGAYEDLDETENDLGAVLADMLEELENTLFGVGAKVDG